MKKSSIAGFLLFFLCLTGLFSQEKNYSEQLITVKSGGVVQLGDVKVEIPAGALKEDTVISITRLNQVEDTGDTISNATMSAGGYRFLPAGTKFNKNVTISIPYEPSLNAKPLVLNDTYTYFYDVEKKGWVQLERKSIDNQNCIIQSYTNHFTDMINATLTMPETASPVDFNLNSIKGLEASKADAQVLNFNPPQGSNYGDAGFSITLDILQGRNGMQPQVSLAYSSSIGNGVLGKGFDINFESAITIDTRKKLPEYNENDIYMLDGTQLRLINKYNDYYEYELKRKTGYQIIRRYNPYSNESDKIDYWEVISSNGVISRYGLEENSTVGQGDKIFTWYLTKIVDQNQNFVEYKYFNDSGYVYIDDIVYTGHEEESGSYHVKFEYEGRLDIRIDARSGQAVSCQKRVKTIKSYYQSEASLFREYVFNYKEGLSESSLLEKFSVYSSYNKDSPNERDSYEYSFDYYDIDGNSFFGTPVKFSSETQLDKSSSFTSGSSLYGSAGGGAGKYELDFRTTGSINKSDSSSNSKTEIILIDITGDGILDRIKTDDETIEVYKGISGGNGFESKSVSLNIIWNGIPQKTIKLNSQSSSSDSFSKTGYAGIYSHSIGVGYSYTSTDTNSTNTSTSCFMDVDADGFVDIVIDTETYLHNDIGESSSDSSSIQFTACKITDFPSFTKSLDTEEKKKLSKNYLMNRPFKVWKAPYNGNVIVNNSVTSSNPNLKGNIYYKNENNAQEKKVVTSNLEISKYLKTNQDIFFVPDTGDDIPQVKNENRNKSMNWDIDIKYTSVKPFVYEGNYIFLMPAPIISITVDYTTDDHGNKTGIKSWSFLDKSIPSGLQRLYTLPTLNSTTGTTSLRSDWKNSLVSLDKSSIEYLINNKKYIPYVITYDQLKSLNLSEYNKQLLQQIYYYDYATNCFYLDDSRITSSNSNIISSIKDQCLNNFNIASIPVKFTVEGTTIKPLYELNKSIELTDNNRFNENTTGTFDEMGSIFNIQTKVGNDFINKIIKDEDTWLLDSEKDLFTLKSVDIAAGKVEIELQDTEYKYIVRLTFKDNQGENAVSVITESEMEYLYEKYKKSFTFSQIKNEIIDYIYTLKSAEDESVNRDDIYIEDDYLGQFFDKAIKSGFISEEDIAIFIQDSVEQELADVFVEKYINYYFYCIQVPAYSKSGDKWIKDSVKTNEILNDTIIEELKLYSYKNYTASIVYNIESKYEIVNFGHNKNGFTILKFNEASELIAIDYKEIVLDNLKLATNSEQSFSALNNVGEMIDTDNVIKGFKVQKTLYGGNNGWYYAIWTGTESENRFLISEIENYLKDDDATISDDLKNITNEEDFENAQKKKLSDSYNNEKDALKESINEERYELLTVTNTISVFENGDNSEIDKKNFLKVDSLKEEETGLQLMDSNENSILIGTISQKSVRDDKKFYFTYYFPYIQGNKINCSRNNGNSFYNVFGMPDNSSSKVLTKTESSGEESNHNITGDFKGISIGASFSTSTNTSNMKQAFMDITGDRIPDVIMLSGNKVTVYKGVLHNKELLFEELEDEKLIMNISTLSLNTSTTKGGGGSLSFGPIFSTKISSTGKLKGVVSTGFDAFTGTDTQYKGFIDINGDGIEDYVTTSGVRLGSVNGLLDNSDFTFSGSISESKVSGDNINFPFTTGIEDLDFLDEEQLKTITELSNNYELNKNKDNEEKLNKAIYGARANSFNLDFQLGVNGSFSSTDTVKFMSDINGDGLLDIIIQDSDPSYIEVKYNLGNSFTEPKKIKLPSWEDNTELLQSISSDSQNSSPNNQDNQNKTKKYSEILQSYYSASGIISFNINVNVAFTFPIFWELMAKVLGTGGVNMNFSWGDSHAETKFMDIDGDGLPDAVIATDKGIFYKKNLSGQADLIKSVKIPQGGVCKIEYRYVAPSYNMPMAKNVMSKVTLTDGSLDEKGQRLDEKGKINENLMPYVNNGDHETVVTYKYENGKYDRAEREYYGFGKLTATSENGNYTVSTFKVDPDEYWLKGCLKESQQYTASDFLLFENTLTYPGEKEAPQSNLPAVDEVSLPVKEETKYYEEPDKNNYVSSKTEYVYDEFLNVTELTTTYNDDETKKIRAKVAYTNDFENNHYSLPVSIEVYGTNESGQEELLRKRIGKYSPAGNLIRLEQYYKTDKSLDTIIDYDEDGYGNIVRVTDPTGVSVEYVYDDLHQFVKTIKQVSSTDNSDFLVTSVEIDPEYQVKRKETDLNGNEMNYEYDNWQRLTEVYSPYDNPGDPCVRFEYFTPKKDKHVTPNKSFWYVITTNKVAFEDVPQGQPNYIKTIVIQDGLSRVVQTAKTGYVCENPEADENSLSFKKGWNVSGSVKYDEYGRVIEQGQTYFVEGESVDTIIKEKYTNNEYVIKAINVTETEYDNRDRVISTKLPDTVTMSTEYSIQGKYLKTVSIDPNQNRTVQFTDAQGKIFKVEKWDANNVLLTSITYEYNMMGEMLKACERGKEDINNPAPENPVTVEYDMLGRTTALEYVDSGRKQYYYGDSTLLLWEDDSRLRNENRKISYKYDGFNRLVTIDYMDKEDTVITYGTQKDTNINAYGRVVSVQDEGTSVSYKYGKLGQVVEETRTITNFIDSNPVKEQKSATMKYQSDYLGRMQKIIYPDGEVVVYSYDYGGQVNKVTGNKLGLDIDYVKNIGYDEQGQRNFIIFGNGVKTTYKYNKQRGWLKNIYTVSYNNNNQLLQNIYYDFYDDGNVKFYINDCKDGGNYYTEQRYTYDALYQLTSVHGDTSFYESAGLHVPTMSSTYDQTFTYDQIIPGNLIKKTSTENSRNTPDPLNYDLDYTYAPGFVHRVERAGDKNFVYDLSGNLILEYDGEKQENPEEDDYVIINQENNVYGTEGAWGYGTNGNGGDVPVYSNKRRYEWDDRNQLIRTVDDFYDTYYVYNNEGQRVAKYTSNTTAMSETLYFNNFWTWHYDTANAYNADGQYSKNIYLGETRIVTRLLTEKDKSDPGLEEKQTYYYHTDHLGSASLVTNSEGKVYERLEYTPYGEVWVDITANTGTLSLYLPYKFSAKEKDSETGLYYYGARYLDPKYSLWKSADPALAEYIPIASTNDEWSKKNSNLPGMGGLFNPTNFHLYHYAGNNPIRYTDPDGRYSNSKIVYNKTETIEYNEYVQKRDAKKADIQQKEEIKTWIGKLLTIIGITPGKGKAVEKTVQIASAVFELLGLAPDNDKKVKEQFGVISDKISDETMLKGEIPNVIIQVTTTITATNYDSQGRGGALYAVPKIEGYYNKKITIKVTINGEVVTFNKKDEEVKEQDKEIVYTNQTVYYPFYLKNYDDFNWTKNFIEECKE